MIITINSLIASLSLKLRQEYGDGINIYSENAEQGFIKPCFFIGVLNPSSKNLLGQRYFRKYPFDITYFPEIENSNNEMQAIASNLYEIMDIITLNNGDKVRGRKMHHEVTGGSLHFYVDFDMILRKIEIVDDYMENMQVKNVLKE